VVSLAGVAAKCETLAQENFAFLAMARRAPKAAAVAGDLGMSAIIMLLKSSMSDAQVAERLRVFLPDDLVGYLACPWTRFIVAYDPATAIEKVTCPILALYFADDGAVPPKTNVPALEAASTRAGNEDVTIRTIPRINHLIQLAAPTPPDAARLDETVAPEVLEIMGAWILERTKSPRAESRR
jgi:pimeloyl-ACP methyl ester carboxylesterase